VLLWLLKGSNGKERLLKDLYKGSKFSEPTIRACLKDLVADGYVEIEIHGDDFRGRSARATAKLWQTMAAYQEQFRQIAAAVVEASASEPRIG